MSQTASSHNLNEPAIDNIEISHDLGQGGEMAESIESGGLLQYDPDEHDDNGSLGDHDQSEIVNGFIFDNDRTAPTHNEPASLHKEKGEQSDEKIEKLVDLFRDFLEAASNPDPEMSNNNSNPPYTQRNTPGRKRLFGLRKGLSPESGSNNRYDYEQKYPRDRLGEETAANARIWLTYLDEAEAFDRERVEGWKDTVDVLLVFAGLFSSVITTFISQASTSLQQDNTQVTASLLFETVQILRAQFSGMPIGSVNKSMITPTSPFTPSTNASLVNGLWFTSLAITLSAALFAVLAKQWLYYYMASISGTPNEKVRARQLRFNGFEQWKVAAIVDLLPILLHIAVGLFLTGIMILLFPLDAHIAWTIVAITSVTFTLYFISVILPIRYPECPYTTSLTIYAGILFFVLRKIFRWVSMISNKRFWTIWEKANPSSRRMIHHLVHYTLDLFRRLFMFISKLISGVCRRLGMHQPRISSFDLPKFTKWREENIRRAVSNATFLDFEAVNWLYTASSDRSVHRIIARSAAVHPNLAECFCVEDLRLLSDTLEINETNVQDLRYGLCLDLWSGYINHWCQLTSISNYVAENELEEGEYKGYRRFQEESELNFIISGYPVLLGFNKLSLDRLTRSSVLPLAMWYYIWRKMSRNRYSNTIMVAHILKPRGTNIFYCSVDPTRELVDGAGLVWFEDNKLGWWKFEYLFDYFGLGNPDFSSETKSYATGYCLLITVYRQLTSDHPLITNKEERQMSLYNLFEQFQSHYNHDRRPEDSFTFFKDFLCVDSFWSGSMTNEARLMAAQAMHPISASYASFHSSTDYHDLSLIYQWCSRDLDEKLSECTFSFLTVLLLSQNRGHLSTIISEDPKATFSLSTCFRNLGKGYNVYVKEVTYPLLMDLLESVEISLLTVLYNSSVLVHLWELILRIEQDPTQFFLLVRSKLDREELETLFTAMKDPERLDDFTFVPNFWGSPEVLKADFDRRLQASLRVFGQIIGRPQELPTPSGAMWGSHRV